MRKLLMLVGVLCFMQELSFARIFLRITKDFSEKTSLAVILITPETDYWRQFSATLQQDLEYSGYFSVKMLKFLPESLLVKQKTALTTDLLLSGRSSGQNAVFTVEDLLDQEKLFRKEFPVTEDARYFAHQVNDEIIQVLTGKPGIARTRVAYVSDRSGSYQIYRIDADGANEVQLTQEPYMLHYPRWLPGNQKLLLVSYEYGWPRLVSLGPGKATTVVSDEPGLNACAAVAPATGETALVLSKSGNPEIYLLEKPGAEPKRLTFSKGVNSSPSFAPDGSQLAFVSDRDGRPQIYIMNRNGFQVRRISYLSGYATSPAWSPDGNFIAYVFLSGGHFGLALYELATGRTIEVESALGAEDISWAPDSRHLAYARVGRKPYSIRIIDVYSREQRRLTPENCNCFSPAWSF